MLLAIGALVVIAAAVIAVLYFTSGDKSAGGAAVGDCVRITSVNEANADVVGVGCADRAAMFTVGKRLTNSNESCPTENYQKGGVGGDYKLCLVPNLKEGECFAGLDAGPDKLVRADCGSQAQLKVTKVIAGRADETACGTEDFPMVYPEPQTTFCLGTP
jgi:hypothetical protein